MKKLSRLTALLLTLVMLVGMMPVSALSGSVTVDIDTWNQWVAAKQAEEDAAAQEEPAPEVEMETVYNSIDVTNTTQVIVRPEVEKSLSVYAGAETGATETATLPIAGKLTLHAYNSASTYQWQVKAAGMWVNIYGDTSDSIVLTHAKLENVMSSNTAYVRCVMTADDASYVSATAKVVLDENVTYETVETMSTIQVQSEQPAMASYGLRSGSVRQVKASGEEELETVNVSIRYLLDGQEIAQTKTFNEPAGTNVAGTVPHPEVQGYVPTMSSVPQGVTFTDASLSFAFENVTESIVLTVVYQPGPAEYMVIHYHQNVNNDEYTIANQETLTGTTNDPVLAKVAPEYDGFRKLVAEELPTIAADSSTVVEVYYLREYYLMLFNLDGGYGVEPIYARYGASLADVGTPTKAGYTFKGWTTTAPVEGTEPTLVDLPATMPAANRTYYAVWQANDTAKVSVVFWGENANDEGYSYLQTGVIEAKPGTSYTFAEGNTVFLICGKEAHTHNEECGPKCGKEEHTQHTEDCLTCGHVCDINCFDAEDSWNTTYELFECSAPTNNAIPSNPKNGTVYSYTTGYNYNRATHYYLYINDTWYCAYSVDWWGNQDDKNDEQEITNVCTHNHSNECYGCETHAHTASCYACGMEEHTHGNGCNQTGSGLESKLWKFVRSETVTVAADGSSVINVYYDRTTFTLHFRKTYSNTDDFGTIEDKWGADIEEEFFEVSDLAGYQSWSRNRDGSATWTNLIAIMPQQDITYYSYTGSGNNVWTMTYYKQNATGTQYEEAFKVLLYRSGNTTVSEEEYLTLEGFDINRNLSTKTGSYTNGAKFYYDRHQYAIEFYSPSEQIKKVEGIFFDASLASYDFVPEDSWIPAQYEPGSVVFEGWYLNPECSGEKYDFATAKMPSATNSGATALVLYAKWIPVTYDVTVYLTKEDAEAGTNPLVATFEVPHGSLATSVEGVTIPSAEEMATMNDPYNFVFWFYVDENGEEKAFDFANMPVKQDLEVYAKWSSDKLVPYTVHFIEEGTGNPISDSTVYLADSVEGSALAGMSKTFHAKGNTELYTNYRVGWFPVTKSHSIAFDINTNMHVYAFEYRQANEVPYTVRYINNATGEPMKLNDDGSEYVKHVTTGYSIVTENFLPFSGFVPDDFQKRLVLSLEEENELIFYYTEDIEHAVYMIAHYTENLDGSWTEYDSETGMDVIGSTITASNVVINGFTFDESLTEAWMTTGESAYVTDAAAMSQELTADGLLIKLFYTRNDYLYQVNYLEEGTGKVLATAKTAYAPYGKLVNEQAIDIENYELVGEDTKSITIMAESTPRLNVINFYYKEETATINYVAVGPEGLNTDGTPKETEAGEVSLDSETIKVLTGTVAGSTAEPNAPNYKFVGWFTDAACTTPVIADWVEGTKLVPQKQDDDNDATTAAIYVGATYYAKFDWNVSTLTITKTVAKANQTQTADIPDDASFTFTVKLPEGEYDYTKTSAASVKTTGKLVIGTNGKGTVTLGNNERIVIEGVVITSDYEVVETVPAYYTLDTTNTSGTSGRIQPNGASVASFTNTYTKYKTGSIDLIKQVKDSTFTEGSKSFDFHVELSSDSDAVKKQQFAEWAEELLKTQNTFTLNEAKTILTVPMTVGYETKTVTETLSGLPLGVYNISETAVTGYDKSGEGSVTVTVDDASTAIDENAPTITITNTAAGTIEIPVVKLWEDNDNLAKIRPGQIEVQLVGEVVTVNEGTEVRTPFAHSVADIAIVANDGQWTGKFENVPKFDPNGNLVAYTVLEKDVANYVATYLPVTVENTAGWQITNTIIPGKLTITKSGMELEESAIFTVEGDNQTFTVVLQEKGSATIAGLKPGATFTVTENNGWSKFYPVKDGVKEAKIVSGKTVTVSFENKKDDQWLHDEDFKKNVFGNK